MRSTAVLIVAAVAFAMGAGRATASPVTFADAPCPAEATVLNDAHARCGFLTVPEHHSRPDGRAIRLMVAIVPAVSSQPAPDPVVHMTGGPGGVDFGEAQLMIAAGLNKDRALILMEQRGSYLTEPALTCPVVDEFNAKLVGLRYDAKSTRRAHVAATRACRRQLVSRGVDLSAYNTSENALDFADLRRALGIAQWNVFGVSYGSTLAQRLMRIDPAGIRSATLDSTVPVATVALPPVWANTRDGFSAVFKACSAQRACRARYPHLERTFTRLVRSLEAHPLTTTVKSASGQRTRVVLDGGALVNWLVSVSLDTPHFAKVPAWIHALAAGDPKPIATARAAGVTPPGFVSYGLLYGVVCREWTPFAAPRDIARAGRRAFPRYPASVLAQAPQFPHFDEDCDAWQVPSAPRSFRAPTRSDIPTLILSGTFDAVTSLAWARDAARTLTRSTIVRIPGVGHSVLPQSKCAQSIEASFLADPTSPSTACAVQLAPPAFATSP
jgi:pimeloyl-ACP methyl ester carboxylesterase